MTEPAKRGKPATGYEHLSNMEVVAMHRAIEKVARKLQGDMARLGLEIKRRKLK